MAATQEKNTRQMVMDLANKYAYDERHAAFVEATSLKILDSLAAVYNFGTFERNLLSHACLLHDIGSFINEKKHHRNTKYIIDCDETLCDYPEKEKYLLSLIAFNHRKKLHEDTLNLSRAERETVLKLSAILRAADSLDYTRETLIIKDVNYDNSNLKIIIEGVLPERLNKRLLEKKMLFNEVFKMDILLDI